MKFIFLSILLGLTLHSQAQRFHGARLGGNIGIASPTGVFADQDSPLDESKGFATVGLDAWAFGDLFLTKHWSLGIRGGYSIYEIDESALLERVSAIRGNDISVFTTPYQNVNLSGTIGYTAYLVEDKLDLNPYLGVGLSVFKTADRRFNETDSLGIIVWDYHLTSELDPGLQFTPGIALNYALMSFIDLRLYGEFSYANYQIEETSVTAQVNDNSRVIVTHATEYYLRAFSIGGGLSLRF